MSDAQQLEDTLVRLLAGLNVCNGQLLIEHHTGRGWFISLDVDGAPARYGEGEDVGTAILELMDDYAASASSAPSSSSTANRAR